ncbi:MULTISPECIES: enoyl-CoA hydratase [Pasteurellaceae]|uniref:enoyl-CoA hydratase n=1 Tax=Pasteurellaceae TaxID=712 RepID=UPI00291D05D1|nr:enoyl-CoA hydratase/carnithine racemase-like protein [uncultured phage]
MATVYLALYKGAGGSLYDRFSDWLIRKITRGQYSHCEIAVEQLENWGEYDYRPIYDCYSSSPRDGGVRCKQINIKDGKWDLILLDNISAQQIIAYFNRTLGAKYDWWGAIGIALGINQKRSKYFCSEWCFNAIHNCEEGWRFSPNQLAVIHQMEVYPAQS